MDERVGPDVQRVVFVEELFHDRAGGLAISDNAAVIDPLGKALGELSGIIDTPQPRQQMSREPDAVWPHLRLEAGGNSWKDVERERIVAGLARVHLAGGCKELFDKA